MDKSQLTAAAEAAMNGDMQAFTELYNEYRDKIYFFARRNTGSDEAAEDIVSETFITAMEKIGTLRSADTFSGWLYSIAYNKCMDVLRANKRVVHFGSEDEQEAVMEEAGLGDHVFLPEDYAVNEDRKAELKAIIDSLKPDMKSAVIMFYYDRQSLADIATALGINENTAKQKLFQARKKIRSKIEKLYKDCRNFTFVPVGALLENTISPAQAKEITAAAPARVSSVSVKAAVISSAAVIAVGSAAAGIFGNYRHSMMGDTRQKTENNIICLQPESDDNITLITDTSSGSDASSETDTSSEVLDKSTSSILSKLLESALPHPFLWNINFPYVYMNVTDRESEGSNYIYTFPDPTTNGSAPSGTGQSGGSSVHTSVEIIPDPEEDPEKEPEVLPQEPDIPHDVITDVTACRIMTFSPDELVEFLGGNYELHYNDIDGLIDITSERMPGYTYSAYICGSEQGTPDGPNEFANPDMPGYKIKLSNTAMFILLEDGAYVTENIRIGMTSAELSQATGDYPDIVNLLDHRSYFYDGWATDYHINTENTETGFIRIRTFFDITEEEEALLRENSRDLIPSEYAEFADEIMIITGFDLRSAHAVLSVF